MKWHYKESWMYSGDGFNVEVCKRRAISGMIIWTMYVYIFNGHHMYGDDVLPGQNDYLRTESYIRLGKDYVSDDMLCGSEDWAGTRIEEEADQMISKLC